MRDMTKQQASENKNAWIESGEWNGMEGETNSQTLGALTEKFAW